MSPGGHKARLYASQLSKVKTSDLHIIYCLPKMHYSYFNDGFYAYFAQAENDL